MLLVICLHELVNEKPWSPFFSKLHFSFNDDDFIFREVIWLTQHLKMVVKDRLEPAIAALLPSKREPFRPWCCFCNPNCFSYPLLLSRHYTLNGWSITRRAEVVISDDLTLILGLQNDGLAIVIVYNCRRSGFCTSDGPSKRQRGNHCAGHGSHRVEISAISVFPSWPVPMFANNARRAPLLESESKVDASSNNLIYRDFEVAIGRRSRDCRNFSDNVSQQMLIDWAKHVKKHTEFIRSKIDTITDVCRHFYLPFGASLKQAIKNCQIFS